MDTNNTIYQTPSTKSQSNKAVAWLGITGSTLLMLSALIFVWSNWQSFPNAIKFGVVALIAGISFITGRFSAKALPVMSNIFTHLALFLVPVVLLSGNMEGVIEWRAFLIFEGIFCAGWFFGLHKIYKTYVLNIASVFSTVMIALGLSSLETTPLGKIPAGLYMIPITLIFCGLKKYSKITPWLILVVGLSPIVALVQPFMRVGAGVVEGFGLSNNAIWYYSVATAVGLLASVILVAKVSEKVRTLSLIPLGVLPHLLLTLVDEKFTLNDACIVIPLFILIVQASIFLLKEDEFFSTYAEKLISTFNVFVFVVESYVIFALLVFHANHLASINSNFGTLSIKPTIGVLLILCVGLVALISERNTFQNFIIPILAMYSIFAVSVHSLLAKSMSVTAIILLAGVIVSAANVFFKKDYLQNTIAPISISAFYILLSDASNIVQLGAFLLLLVVFIYGVFVSDKSSKIVEITSPSVAVITTTFCLTYISEVFSGKYHELIIIMSVGVFNLVLCEITNVLVSRRSFIFDFNGIRSLTTAPYYFLGTALISTWWAGNLNGYIVVAYAGASVLIGAYITFARKDSFALSMVAPTLIIGLYQLLGELDLEKYASIYLVVIASGFTIATGYVKYAKVAFIVNAATCVVFGLASALSTPSMFGQVLIASGLMLATIGLVTKQYPLVPIGGVTSIFGYWITLNTENVTSLQAYVAPVCLALIIVGMYVRKVFPGQVQDQTQVSSWAAYAFPLCMYEFTVLIELYKTNNSIHSLIGGAVAIAAISIGAWRKLSAPLFIGTASLIIIIGREVFFVASTIPLWVWVGIGALTLISVAVLMERTQNLHSARKFASTLKDTFE